MNDLNSIVYSAAQLSRHQKMPLKGFDAKYMNLPSYIIDITHNIWESKGIGVLHETYGEDISLHIGVQTSYGRDGVISSTLDTQQTFPDRTLFGEEVIWSEAKNDSYLSSHRLGCMATHTGKSKMYGKPTGKQIFYRVMADCVCKDNFIIEEWLIRDEYHMYKQLGICPVKKAKQTKRYKSTPRKDLRDLQERNKIGQLTLSKSPPAPTNNSTVDVIVALYHQMFYLHYFDKVTDFYLKTAQLHSICEKRYNGHKQIQDFYIDFFASVPNATVTIDRITHNSGAYVDKVAVRWTVKGVHENFGEFGKPSDKEICIVGITHYEIVGDRVLQEWNVFDKFDVLCQIYASEDKKTSK